MAAQGVIATDDERVCWPTAGPALLLFDDEARAAETVSVSWVRATQLTTPIAAAGFTFADGQQTTGRKQKRGPRRESGLDENRQPGMERDNSGLA